MRNDSIPQENALVRTVDPMARPEPMCAEVHARLSGVTRVYTLPSGESLHALGPVDLELRRGEFFSVVGPSGCGKSTLLDVLAGLAAPTDGGVEFEGRPVRGEVP